MTWFAKAYGQCTGGFKLRALLKHPRNYWCHVIPTLPKAASRCCHLPDIPSCQESQCHTYLNVYLVLHAWKALQKHYGRQCCLKSSHDCSDGKAALGRTGWSAQGCVGGRHKVVLWRGSQCNAMRITVQRYEGTSACNVMTRIPVHCYDKDPSAML